jgi:aerobic carbon-monoxide dehydrogenase large subunit
MTEVGSRLKRLEDGPLLIGRGRYLDDIKAPGALAVAFLRSPHPNAAIDRIDASAARAMPGVHAVLALDDLRPVLARVRMPLGFRSSKLPPAVTPHILANRDVAFVGQVVAMVVAETRHIAEDAAEAIEVDYTLRPAVADIPAALAPDAPPVRDDFPSAILTTFNVAYGDTDAVFRTAPCIVTDEIHQQRGGAHPIEGRGILARYDTAEDVLSVWSSTQMPHELFYMASDVLGLDENRVKLATPDVGGGFGAKYAVYPEELAVIAAAKLLERDLKWVEDRREHFIGSIQERDQIWHVELALDLSGKILGLRGTMVHDQGAYTLQDVNVAYNASTSLPGPYSIPAYRLDVTVVQTNKTPVLTVRGAGYPQACFTMERLMDEAARKLGMDRAALRRRNLIPPEKMPYEKPLRARSGAPIWYDCGDFPACQDELLLAADWDKFPARQAEARAKGRYLGIGLAHGVKGTGRGPFESGMVRIMPSGRITVFTGAAAMGQGIATALAQICADQLGVSTETVSVVAGDARTVPIGLGGFGSRQLVMAGSSVQLASQAVATKMRKMASHLLEASETDLALTAGYIHVVGTPPQAGRSLADIANILRGSPGAGLPADVEPGCEATFNFRSDSLAYANVCHIAEVEVDPETGGVHILRYTAMQDSGVLINPMIVDGQTHGSVAHGLGNALFEWMGYDAEAQPVTTTLADYLLPTSTEVPRVTALYRQTPSPMNPLGAKGVGEVGTVPVAAAIISAVEDALQPFGVRVSCAPLSPAHTVALVRKGMQAARRPCSSK